MKKKFPVSPITQFIFMPILMRFQFRATTAGKVPKAWALPRFWVSIRFYKKQPVKKRWGRIQGLAWLKFAMAALDMIQQKCIYVQFCWLPHSSRCHILAQQCLASPFTTGLNSYLHFSRLSSCQLQTELVPLLCSRQTSASTYIVKLWWVFSSLF